MIINTGGRTDIVQYFTPWLLNRFRQGYVLSRNPMYPNQITKYLLKPSVVDCVLFCSKNYEPILPHLNHITDNFNTYFFYTITAYGKDIEPGVPHIDKSIDTLIKLEKQVGKQRIVWRYDPVLLTRHYTIQQHLITFEHMAARLYPHVDRCVFSFVDMYKKLETNMSELIPFAQEDMDTLAMELGRIARKYRLPIQICASRKDYSKYGILKAGCVNLENIGKANGIEFRKLRHQGMRPKNPGCHCMISHDIGAYDTCPNGCHYCYANQTPESALAKYKLHDPDSPLLIGSVTPEDTIKLADQKSFIQKPDRQLNLF